MLWVLVDTWCLLLVGPRIALCVAAAHKAVCRQASGNSAAYVTCGWCMHAAQRVHSMAAERGVAVESASVLSHT